MIKRFLQRHVNAFSFWSVVILVAAALALAAYAILPPARSGRAPNAAPTARP